MVFSCLSADARYWRMARLSIQIIGATLVALFSMAAVASPALIANRALRTGATLGSSPFLIGPGRIGETTIVPSIPLLPGSGISATAAIKKSATSVAPIIWMDRRAIRQYRASADKHENTIRHPGPPIGPHAKRARSNDVDLTPACLTSAWQFDLRILRTIDDGTRCLFLVPELVANAGLQRHGRCLGAFGHVVCDCSQRNGS